MISPSMKSASGSAPRANKWKLARTLKRDIYFRPIEDEDLKYLWAAYKQGAFEFEKRDMGPAEFKSEIEKAILSSCHAAWVLFGQQKPPVGLVLAAWSPVGTFLTVAGAIWMPWASKRNIIECAVGFLRRIHSQYPMQIYVLPEHRRLYEICAMHGVVKRIGTSSIAIPGKQTAVFETMTPKKRLDDELSV